MIKAHSLKDARKQLEINKVDVVFLDLNIEQRLDGITLLKEIKEKYNGIPVIIVTSEADKGVVSDVIRLGPKGYIVKPLSISNIEKSLNLAMSHKQHALFD